MSKKKIEDEQVEEILKDTKNNKKDELIAEAEKTLQKSTVTKSKMTMNDVAKISQGEKKKKEKSEKRKVKIEDMPDLPDNIKVIDLNYVQEVKPIIVDDEIEVDHDVNAPEIVSILKLKKKTGKEVKQEKRRLKKSGRIVTRKHIKNLKKGLEVPRYKVKLDYGLTDESISRRINEGLVNNKVANASKTYKRILFTNIVTFFNFVTIGIAAWLISVGAFQDLIFMFLITSNIIIGIYQEVKAKKTIDRLSILSAPSATVIRNGEEKEIQIDKLVIDDLMILDTGRQIVTDSIVVDGIIEVNESLLTGESDAIVKRPGDLLYGGSFVVSGTCKAQVERVGKDNFIETLTSQAKKHKKPKSELLNALNTIIRVMSVVIIILGGLLFFMQYLSVPAAERTPELYIRAVRGTAGAMLGMIPAGLFLMTSVALFIGVIKLADYNVLVRELYSLEMLARINVLCLDKTGTITDGTMKVKNVVEFSTVGTLNTKSIVSALLNALNDRNLTSVALEEMFGTEKKIKHDEVIPFSSSRKYSAVDFAKYGTFAMGAPEIIMKHKYSQLEKDVNKYSQEGYRVIAIAHSSEKIKNQEIDLKTFQAVSLILIEDNIRPDAIETIKYFKESGVEVKVISGDNPLTVAKIAQRSGIENAERCISLDGLTDEEVIQAADKFTVFGRVSPGQKRLLVKTLKKQDKVVAMTGDGVNDILALKEADCSISVASGSEAARSVSHLVLLDDNFGSMPRVVSEGRRVINNIAKVAALFLTKTIFSLLLAIQAVQRGGIYPIRTIQLLMIDLLVIGIPSFVLVLEPNNVKAAGNFLVKIIKSALPGAVAILITTMIVFALQDTLNLDFRQTSTIIVISATFTSMMVLFEVCKPFNTMRKTLSMAMFSIFVFVTLLMPQIFEFSPLINFATYTDDTEVLVRAWDHPSIGITGDHYVVVDNRLAENADGIEITHNRGELVNPHGTINPQTRQLSVMIIQPLSGASNPIPTNIFVDLPELLTVQRDTDLIVFDALPTNTMYNENLNVFVLPNGDVVLADTRPTGQETNLNVITNILPSVGVAFRGNTPNLVVDGNMLSISSINRVERVELIWDNNRQAYYLHVNQIRVTGTGEDLNYGFRVESPVVSEYNNYFAVGGSVTTLNAEAHQLDTELLSVTPTGIVELNGYDTGVGIMPLARTTGTSRYWIVDGVVTNHLVSGRINQNTVSFTDLVITSGHDTPNRRGVARLVLNQTITEFTIDVTITVGGEVPMLPQEALILLLLLCAISAPLIKVIKQVVPWTKARVEDFLDLISNMQ